MSSRIKFCRRSSMIEYAIDQYARLDPIFPTSPTNDSAEFNLSPSFANQSCDKPIDPPISLARSRKHAYVHTYTRMYVSYLIVSAPRGVGNVAGRA